MILSRRRERVLLLSPILRCPYPRCQRIPFGIDGDLLTIGCRACGGRWWASRLEAGNIRAQLRRDFDGDETIIRFLDLHGAPFVVPEPMYLEVTLSKEEQHSFIGGDRRRGMRERTKLFFQSIIPARGSA